MDTGDLTYILQIVVVVEAVLAALLWIIPGPCQCDQCVVHSRERREEAERRRVKRHQQRHSDWGIEWGDGGRCQSCAAGNDGDREVK